MQTYSYDPTKIIENGLHKMRFELGDTVTDMGGISAVLCDEEYEAILGAHGKNWRKAKLMCLDAILMKLSYEVNTSVDGLSYSLSERYDRFKQMKEEAKNELAAIGGLPVANKASLSPAGGTPYFYNDMQANHRKYRGR